MPSTTPNHARPNVVLPFRKPAAATRAKEARAAFEANAETSLASYFGREPGAPLTPAHAEVAAVLATLKAHRRAALAMHHGVRVWPEALKTHCGRYASLIVRLYCVDHPATGSTRKVEAAAADQLVAMIPADGRHHAVLGDLYVRALVHTERATCAFLKALNAHRSTAR
jgi:hypothetical protein